MDAFKQNEILRMQHGGNKAWQDFYNSIIGSENGGKSFEDSSIKERYESDVGDEWKERLSAKVEDKDFDREAWKKEREAYKAKAAANTISRTETPIAGPRKGANGTSSSSRSESPAPRSTLPPSLSQKQKNEAYFSHLGAANASRPENLPPSQGGRLSGFGSSPTAAPSTDPTQPRIPNSQEFQTDPVAALTKSLGWLTTSLTRTAKTVNESYIQPTAKTIAASDLAAQARAAALQAGNGIQTSAKVASESLSRFVDGENASSMRPGSGGGGGAGRRAPEPERKDFWDTFAEPATAAAATERAVAKPKASSIGTAAMRKGGGGGGEGVGGGSAPPGSAPAPATAGKGKGKDDGWDDW